MNGARDQPRTGIQHEGLERLLAFSDGVFAIAITLLILDIHLPEIEGQLGNAELLARLLALWPKVFAYLLSFAMVAIFWVKHHATFRAMHAYDGRLVWLNMVLLLVVSFVPFPTAVMSTQHNGTGLAFYDLTMALGFAVSAWLWWHATGHGLAADGLEPGMRGATLVASLVPCGVFLLSAALAMVDVHWGRLALLVLFPATNAQLWRRRRRPR